MSQYFSTISRTTQLMSSNRLVSDLRNTQRELLEQQIKISTGKEINKPSDAPGRITTILMLEDRIQQRDQHAQNLQHAESILNNTDAALADTADLLIEARSIASSESSLGSTPETRAAQAIIVASQLSGLVEIANRNFQDVALFGGRSGNAEDGLVFSEFLGGVRFSGEPGVVLSDLGFVNPLGINASGDDAFGALSARVESQVDLDPAATGETRLADLGGAEGRGIRRGTIEVQVGAETALVDLADADDLDDVVLRVNQAIDSLDPGAGGLTVAGSGLSLTAAGGRTVTIRDPAGERTAADLGIDTTASGETVAGEDVHVLLTEQTTLASLGTAVDLASGLKITQGGVTKIADFSGAETVQDLVNQIDRLDLGLRLEINKAGNGLNLKTEVSGLELSVGENAGGTTAGDLGIRTYGNDTLLSDFNRGAGVGVVNGEDDFSVQLHSGATFSVNLDGAQTVADMVTAIRGAAAGAGLVAGDVGDAGTDFNVGLAADGNGLQIEDLTGGAADFEIVNLGTSTAAHDLGIRQGVGGGSTIAGDDRAKVRVEGAFTYLMDLQSALAKNDTFGITIAAGDIQTGLEQANIARADVAARGLRVQNQQERTQDLKLTEQTLLSNIQDADLTEVITRFTQLQQQLQATLQTGAANLQLNLLDFLR